MIADHSAISTQAEPQNEATNIVANGGENDKADAVDEGDIRSIKTESDGVIVVKEESWAWMYDVDYEDYFMCYDDEYPAKSSDFSSGGFTASLTNWHEFLQLTAPDRRCGTVFIRGMFPYTPDSILARVQCRDRAGGKGTFGIQLIYDVDSEFELGEVVVRGLINYRWPHMQYVLHCKSFEVGFFETCSFVEKNVVYQVARICPGEKRTKESTNSIKANEMGPPEQPREADIGPPFKRIARFRIGGTLSFGCRCTSRVTSDSLPKYRYTVDQREEIGLISCKILDENSNCRSQGSHQGQGCLNMQLFVDGNIRAMNLNQKSENAVKLNGKIAKEGVNDQDIGDNQGSLSERVDLFDVQDIELEAEKEAPESDDVKKILGVGESNADYDDWVQSLEDTPDRYRSSQTKDIYLRTSLLRYLQGFEDSRDISTKPPSYSRDTIHKLVPTGDLLYLNVFDFGLEYVDWPELNLQWGRCDIDDSRKSILREIEAPEDSADTLWNWLIDSLSWADYPSPDTLPKKLKEKLQQDNCREEIFRNYHNRGIARLTDSMVDLGVKHRIFLAERCSPSVVQAFVYMWHPRAIDTFDSYFSSISTFINSREDETWTTTITLVHWAFDLKSTRKNRYSESRQRGEFPPGSVAKLQRLLDSKKLKKSARGNQLSTGSEEERTKPEDAIGFIEARSSALVITGDPQGYLWTCSIWSLLIDSREMPQLLRKVESILGLFKPQQSSDRSLAFLFLLGIIVEKLSLQVERMMKSLENYVELGQQVFLEGYDWEADDAVDKLRTMLWGLEALKMFDDRLSSSLSSIEKARKDLEDTINSDPVERHSKLKQKQRNVMEEFGKRYAFFTDLHVRIQLKTRQLTGLRDGLSTVTNVQDSHTAVKQGNNIRILIYITIAYLPLGFITALFSTGHGIVPDDAGIALFAIFISVFVFATYGLALSMETIIKIFHPAKGRLSIWLYRPHHPPGGNSTSSNNKQTEQNITSENQDTNEKVEHSGSHPEKRGGFLSFRHRHRGRENVLDSAEKATCVSPTEVHDFAS